MARSKDVQLSIPRSVTDALALLKAEKKKSSSASWPSFCTGKRCFLLARPFGRARELAGTGKQEFGQLLGGRDTQWHYGPEEPAEDLRYAKGEASSQDASSQDASSQDASSHDEGAAE